MKEIKLTQEAYLSGSYYRLPTEDGAASVYAMEGSWYEAPATDDEGNKYLVLWEILESYEEGDDESDACSWESPAAVVSLDPWCDATGKVTVVL